MPGFPVFSGESPPGYLSAANIDADPEPEIILAAGRGSLHAFNLDGSRCPDFPHQYYSSTSYSGTSTFINADSAFIIYIGNSRYSNPGEDTTLIYMSHDWRSLSGFPIVMEGHTFYDYPVIIPPMNDTLIIATINQSGVIGVYDLPLDLSGFKLEWSMAGANPQRNGVYQPVEYTSAGRTPPRGNLPTTIRLGNPYPNPCNGSVRIALPGEFFDTGYAIFDITCRKILQGRTGGTNFIGWNLTDYTGSPVSSGIYLLYLEGISKGKQIVVAR